MSGEAPRTSLVLPRSLRARLAELASSHYPREACGLLLGRRRGVRSEVALLAEARNRECLRAGERYDLDPADHLAAEERARELGLEVVGVWHSHPDRPALPSELDRARAWHAWSYVILSATEFGAGDARSWRLAEGRLIEEDVIEAPEVAQPRSSSSGQRGSSAVP